MPEIGKEGRPDVPAASAEELSGWREPDRWEKSAVKGVTAVREEQGSGGSASGKIILAIVLVAAAAAAGAHALGGVWALMPALAGIATEAALGAALYGVRKTEREKKEIIDALKESEQILVLDCTAWERVGGSLLCVKDTAGKRCSMPFLVHAGSEQASGAAAGYVDAWEKDNARPFLLVRKVRDGETIGVPWLLDKEYASMRSMGELAGWRKLNTEEERAAADSAKRRARAQERKYMPWLILFCAASVFSAAFGISLYAFTGKPVSEGMEHLLMLAIILACGTFVGALGAGRLVRAAGRMEQDIWDGVAAALPCTLCGLGEEYAGTAHVKDYDGNVSEQLFEIPAEILEEEGKPPLLLVYAGAPGHGQHLLMRKPT